MSDTLNIRGHRVLIYTRGNGFRYRGAVLDETELFLFIHNEHDQRQRVIAKSEIASLEVLT